MTTRLVSLAGNSVLQGLSAEAQAAAELRRKRSEAARKGAETKRTKARIEALKPRIRNLFAPAPIFRPHAK